MPCEEKLLFRPLIKLVTYGLIHLVIIHTSIELADLLRDEYQKAHGFVVVDCGASCFWAVQQSYRFWSLYLNIFYTSGCGSSISLIRNFLLEGWGLNFLATAEAFMLCRSNFCSYWWTQISSHVIMQFRVITPIYWTPYVMRALFLLLHLCSSVGCSCTHLAKNFMQSKHDMH